ncbi:hypothetical protein PUN28_019288 [Cardiocondyla obscurior]|uniref:Uncharacterized protein n=1 Tax=Cardiocondyla obscurior TaxID=286306 RepID=A0AAW2EF44_9HYME
MSRRRVDRAATKAFPTRDRRCFTLLRFYVNSECDLSRDPRASCADRVETNARSCSIVKCTRGKKRRRAITSWSHTRNEAGAISDRS